MSVFHFKRFDVVNERSAMKVNTDGVLLGAAMTMTAQDRRMLDVGTGTGTIALMAAQRAWELSCQPVREPVPTQDGAMSAIGTDTRGDIMIDAIDVDEPSASEAAVNFGNSPWADTLAAYNISLDAFARELEQMGAALPYDLIFSNPPYFEDSLIAPDERKSAARHTSEGLSYRDIFDFATKWLSDNGRLALVLPADQETAVCRYARMSGLHLLRIMRVRTVTRKTPSRMIVEFSRHRVGQPEDTVLTLQNEGQYTEEYLSLTREFYLFA